MAKVPKKYNKKIKRLNSRLVNTYFVWARAKIFIIFIFPHCKMLSWGGKSIELFHIFHHFTRMFFCILIYLCHLWVQFWHNTHYTIHNKLNLKWKKETKIKKNRQRWKAIKDFWNRFKMWKRDDNRVLTNYMLTKLNLSLNDAMRTSFNDVILKIYVWNCEILMMMMMMFVESLIKFEKMFEFQKDTC